MEQKEYPFDRYGSDSIRVIIDTDCACEGDDPFAVAHALITTKFDVRAVNAANFLYRRDSVEKSYEAIQKLIEAMDLEHVNVLRGSLPMTSRDEYETSEAAEFIIQEALRDDPRPLFVAVQGAITNLAVALREAPQIADRLTCIWIGGAPYPDGGWEFNMCNDLTAARIVMESQVALWQVPSNVYSMMRVSFMTLYKNLYPCGRAGKYLCTQLWEFNARMQAFHRGGENPMYNSLYAEQNMFNNSPEEVTGFGCGECWQLGDSPVVGLMLNCQRNDRDFIGAPGIRDDGTYILSPENPRRIYVYRTIDSSFILDDFFNKMQYRYGPEQQEMD